MRPDTRIPVHIQRLTGISNEMVASAPRFEDIADDLFDQLDGRVFVAHNARFDHSHIKAAYKRMGVTLRPRVLCTVKLSRRLFPHEKRHSLDHLITRHGLDAGSRHRALSDAQVLWQFWQHVHGKLPAFQLESALRELLGQATFPPFLDPADIQALPDTPGVYLFYGENDIPLYVGKSTRIRSRVLAHFSADHSNDKALSLSQQVRRIRHIATQGELGALLEEARLIKAMQPTHNRQLRRNRELCAWQADADLFGGSCLRLVRVADMTPPSSSAGPAAPGVYGFFRSRRAAIEKLRGLCAEHHLCPPLLGLEPHTPGRCFTHQVKRCMGACLGHESLEAHTARTQDALASLKLQSWPYAGPVGIREGSLLHVVNNWCYYGTTAHASGASALLSATRPAFDVDIQKILQQMMNSHEVLPLSP